MAKFKVGSWVKVIPSPDTKSDVWTSAHNKFCGRIGEVIDLNDSYDDMVVLRVSVHFDYKQTSLYGAHSAWFEDKHLIMSSKWELDREIQLNKQFEEYLIFEKNIKKKRDDILKEIFSDPYEDKTKKEETKEQDDDDSEEWAYGDGWIFKNLDTN